MVVILDSDFIEFSKNSFSEVLSNNVEPGTINFVEADDYSVVESFSQILIEYLENSNQETLIIESDSTGFRFFQKLFEVDEGFSFAALLNKGFSIPRELMTNDLEQFDQFLDKNWSKFNMTSMIKQSVDQLHYIVDAFEHIVNNGQFQNIIIKNAPLNSPSVFNAIYQIFEKFSTIEKMGRLKLWLINQVKGSSEGNCSLSYRLATTIFTDRVNYSRLGYPTASEVESILIQKGLKNPIETAFQISHALQKLSTQLFSIEKLKEVLRGIDEEIRIVEKYQDKIINLDIVDLYQSSSFQEIFDISKNRGSYSGLSNLELYVLALGQAANILVLPLWIYDETSWIEKASVSIYVKALLLPTLQEGKAVRGDKLNLDELESTVDRYCEAKPDSWATFSYAEASLRCSVVLNKKDQFLQLKETFRRFNERGCPVLSSLRSLTLDSLESILVADNSDEDLLTRVRNDILEYIIREFQGHYQKFAKDDCHYFGFFVYGTKFILTGTKYKNVREQLDKTYLSTASKYCHTLIFSFASLSMSEMYIQSLDLPEAYKTIELTDIIASSINDRRGSEMANNKKQLIRLIGVTFSKKDFKSITTKIFDIKEKRDFLTMQAVISILCEDNSRARFFLKTLFAFCRQHSIMIEKRFHLYTLCRMGNLLDSDSLELFQSEEFKSSELLITALKKDDDRGLIRYIDEQNHYRYYVGIVIEKLFRMSNKRIDHSALIAADLSKKFVELLFDHWQDVTDRHALLDGVYSEFLARSIIFDSNNFKYANLMTKNISKCNTLEGYSMLATVCLAVLLNSSVSEVCIQLKDNQMFVCKLDLNSRKKILYINQAGEIEFPVRIDDQILTKDWTLSRKKDGVNILNNKQRIKVSCLVDRDFGQVCEEVRSLEDYCQLLSVLSSCISRIWEKQNYLLALTEKNMSIDQVSRKAIEFGDLAQKANRQVELKNKEIRTIMKNINQGIFTVGSELKISHIYSPFLETILGHNEIAGRSIKDAFLQESDLLPDRLATCLEVIKLLIGETILSFDINEHNLVRKVNYKSGNGIKVLEMDWLPIIESGTIVQLMAIVRDVTEWKKLEEVSQLNRDQSEIIGTMLLLSADDLRHYFEKVGNVLEWGSSHTSEWNESKVNRDIHTLKGISRILGFEKGANYCHLLESALKNELEIENTLAEFINYFSKAKEIFTHYFGDKLNQSIALIDGVKRLSSALVNYDIDAEHRKFVTQLFEILGVKQNLSAILDPLTSGTPDIATSLGKEPPKILFTGDNAIWDYPIHQTLLMVFTHLINNSLDHGIETASERERLGKPPRGELRISVRVKSSGILELDYEDDGRGLDIDKIRKTGIDLGLISSEQSLTDHEIAGMIFNPKFTTKSDITEISGRGIGLDAVQAYMEESGHSISVKLKKRNPLDGFISFKFYMEFHLNHGLNVA